MSNDFFKMRGIVKQYQMGNEVQTILKGIDLDIEEGEFLSILGPSGSGKSTLMNIIGCLDTPTSGEYILHGRMIRDLDENQLAHIRSKEIGFIFQGFNLIPSLTAKGNVELPLIYRGVKKEEREKLSVDALRRVGLEKRMNHLPSQMSGGQQQRVAIARAVAARPPIILADEPTGNLDPKNSLDIMNLLEDINKRGTTVVVVTHNKDIVNEMKKRVITLKKGVIISDEKEGGYIDED